jgi:cysteinyl-tRNA synthetase
MSEAVSDERKKILLAMGAELKFTPAHLGTDGAIEFVYELIREEPDKYWLADQFNNDANWISHYEGTAMEIWEETGGNLDMVVATMGTTGTLMGLARRFAQNAPAVQIVGVEPYLGHKIQGLKNMKESYRPGIFDKSRVDRIECLPRKRASSWA